MTTYRTDWKKIWEEEQAIKRRVTEIHKSLGRLSNKPNPRNNIKKVRK